MENKYILSIYKKDYNENNAASKAVMDIEEFANEIGYETLQIFNKSDSKLIKLKDIFLNLREIWNINKGLVLFQYPATAGFLDKIISKLYIEKLRNKGVKTIAIIHDLESLRYLKDKKNNYKYINHEISVLNMFEYVISHNETMSTWLKNNGLKSQILELELFDYKCNNNKTEKTIQPKSIVFAGNLDRNKSEFVYKLKNINFKEININLYGPNYDNLETNNGNITYKGVYKPEELNKVFNEQFGLIWDGKDLETCSGDIGEYTRYNNPHKLSLYISCGLPVIVWKEAAISKLVEKYNIGISISSIQELEDAINNITPLKYSEMKNNIIDLKDKVSNGFFIKKAISIVENNNF